MATRELPSLLQLTAFNESYLADPNSLLDDLRGRCPVHRDGEAGTYILTRYADARETLGNRTFRRDPAQAEAASLMRRTATIDDALRRSETISILQLDDPDHGRIRKLLTGAFNPRVKASRPMIESIVADTIARIDASRPFDLVERFCIPIPVDGIAQLLGVDHRRLDEFREWSEGAILFLNPRRTPEQTALMQRSHAALAEYFSALFVERRSRPQDDFITDMVRLQADGAPISDVELRINLVAMLLGGNLTTSDLIASASWLLMTNPGERQKLRQNPRLVVGLVEEALRLEPPVDMTSRVASEDVEIGGCPFGSSQTVNIWLRAANMDPAAFEDPHSLRIDRKRVPHVAFGGGSHLCLGASLARLEAQIALSRLFERFPDLALARPDAPLVWRRLPFFRGLAQLEVVA